jgi:hypothetical protein
VRVIFDTNVVVSAAFFGGPPRRVIDAWIDGQLELVISPSIFDEYLRVCHRLSASYPQTDYQPLLTAFLAHGLLVGDSTAERSITGVASPFRAGIRPTSRSSQSTRRLNGSNPTTSWLRCGGRYDRSTTPTHG